MVSCGRAVVGRGESCDAVLRNLKDNEAGKYVSRSHFIMIEVRTPPLQYCPTGVHA